MNFPFDRSKSNGKWPQNSFLLEATVGASSFHSHRCIASVVWFSSVIESDAGGLRSVTASHSLPTLQGPQEPSRATRTHWHALPRFVRSIEALDERIPAGLARLGYLCSMLWCSHQILNRSAISSGLLSNRITCGPGSRQRSLQACLVNRYWS